MSKHTPEPWEVGGPYPSVCIMVMVDGGNAHPAHAEEPRYEPIAFLWGAENGGKSPPDEIVANATRIVECVNAMKNIPDPAAFVAACWKLADSAGTVDTDDGEEMAVDAAALDRFYVLLRGTTNV